MMSLQEDIEMKHSSKESVKTVGIFLKPDASLHINTKAIMVASSHQHIKVTSILGNFMMKSILKVFFFYVFGTTIYIHVIIYNV